MQFIYVKIHKNIQICARYAHIQCGYSFSSTNKYTTLMNNCIKIAAQNMSGNLACI